MEKLERSLTKLQSILKVFDRMLKKLEKARNNPDKYDHDDIRAYRDSSIKTFELSFELFWKTLQKYLEINQAVATASPKKTVHACLEKGVVSLEESKSLLAMVDIRNATIHDYDEDFVYEISKQLPMYHDLMDKISARLKS